MALNYKQQIAATVKKTIKNLDDGMEFYNGIAKLKKRRPAPGKSAEKNTISFTLIADNGEVVSKGSQPYDRKQGAIKTLKKYFPNFLIVDEIK